MKLEKVTITGADDSTAISDLVELSAEFPFVEWGILVSKKLEGSARFPSRSWINEFCCAAREHNINVSTHICGRWVRELLVGFLDWDALPEILQVAQRVQINVHSSILPSEASTALLSKLWEQESKRFILQCHVEGNERLVSNLQTFGVSVAALFDASGGLGKCPEKWPAPHFSFQCGFAGGLGADNILTELEHIDGVCPPDYLTWVDMERRVRLPDDSALAMALVRSVLVQTKSSKWLLV
jgi:phosphoribosylanthranilate isomerase